MRIKDVLIQWETYPFSKECFLLEKECMELEMIQQYIRNQEFILEHQEYLSDDYNFTEGFFVEAAGADTLQTLYEAEAEKNAALGNKIQAAFRAFFDKFFRLFTRIVRGAGDKNTYKNINHIRNEIRQTPSLQSSQADKINNALKTAWKEDYTPVFKFVPPTEGAQFASLSGLDDTIVNDMTGKTMLEAACSDTKMFVEPVVDTNNSSTVVPVSLEDLQKDIISKFQIDSKPYGFGKEEGDRASKALADMENRQVKTIVFDCSKNGIQTLQNTNNRLQADLEKKIGALNKYDDSIKNPFQGKDFNIKTINDELRKVDKIDTSKLSQEIKNKINEEKEKIKNNVQAIEMASGEGSKRGQFQSFIEIINKEALTRIQKIKRLVQQSGSLGGDVASDINKMTNELFNLFYQMESIICNRSLKKLSPRAMMDRLLGDNNYIYNSYDNDIDADYYSEARRNIRADEKEKLFDNKANDAMKKQLNEKIQHWIQEFKSSQRSEFIRVLKSGSASTATPPVTVSQKWKKMYDATKGNENEIANQWEALAFKGELDELGHVKSAVDNGENSNYINFLKGDLQSKIKSHKSSVARKLIKGYDNQTKAADDNKAANDQTTSATAGQIHVRSEWGFRKDLTYITDDIHNAMTELYNQMKNLGIISNARINYLTNSSKIYEKNSQKIEEFERLVRNLLKAFTDAQGEEDKLIFDEHNPNSIKSQIIKSYHNIQMYVSGNNPNNDAQNRTMSVGIYRQIQQLAAATINLNTKIIQYRQAAVENLLVVYPYRAEN